jgi:PAS domain S-box-containing protein
MILDSVPALIWYKDRENRIIRANAAAAAARGVTKKDMEGRLTSDLYPDEADAYYQDDLEVMRTGRPKMGIVEPLVAESGEKRWLRTDKIPYPDENGQIIGVIVFATDITDLKMAEEALRREQHLMQLLMDNIPDAIYFKDRQSLFMRINPAQARYIGVEKPQDAVGRPDTDFFPPESAAEYFADEQNVIRTGQALIGKIEHNGRTGDERRWFSTSKVPIRDDRGTIIGTAGISHDITALKRVQEDLRREQQLMQIMMDNMPDAIYFKDRDSRFLRTNLAHARIMNLKNPEEAIGRSDADFFPPDDAAAFRADERDVIETGRSLVGKIEHHGGATGEMRWWSTTKVPVRDASGVIMGLAGITRDITPIKRAEEEIRKLNEELEQRVLDRTAMLETANRQLQDEVAERREAQSTIEMYQERLRSLALELSLAEERERRRIAVDLHDQIGQTLALIQIRLEAMRETVAEGPLARELDACVELFRQPIDDTRSLVFHLSPPVLYDLGLAAAAAWIVDQHDGQRGLSIKFEDDERPKPLDHAVSVLVFRAIRELVTNLVKHSKAKNAKVWLKTSQDELTVGVEDDGCGFDTVALTQHSTAGRGFGLFSIREQLERVGGSMNINSAIGGPTCIMLTVPLRAAQAADGPEGLP